MTIFYKFTRLMVISTVFISSLIYAQSEKEYIAVVDLRGKITKSEAAALTSKVINEIIKTGKYLIFERSQMGEILKEQGFQQTGCTSAECAIEIGQLLGVRQIVFGNIEKVGKIYSISLKMVNVQTGKIEKSTSLDFKGTIEEILTKGIITAVHQLLGLKKTLTLAEQADRRRITLKTTFAVISAVTGISSGGISIYYWSEKSKYYEEYIDSYSQVEMDKYLEKGNNAYTLAGIFTGVSAVCIPTSILLFALRTKKKKKSNVSIKTFISPEIGIISFSCTF